METEQINETRRTEQPIRIESLDSGHAQLDRSDKNSAHFIKVVRVNLLFIVYGLYIFAIFVSSFSLLIPKSSGRGTFAALTLGLVGLECLVRKKCITKGRAFFRAYLWIREEQARLGIGAFRSVQGNIESISGGFRYANGYSAGSIHVTDRSGKNVVLRTVLVPSLLEPFLQSGTDNTLYLAKTRNGGFVLFGIRGGSTVQEASKQARALAVEVQSEELGNPDSSIRRLLRSPAMIVFLPVLPLVLLIPMVYKYGGAPSAALMHEYIETTNRVC